MNQQKIGLFLKELRNEKNMTQEELAEEFNVSRRTVSRWETGSNMPDLSVILELSDFYDVDIRELLDGERKSEDMVNEQRETIQKVADYTAVEKNIKTKRLNTNLIVATTFLVLVILNSQFGIFGLIFVSPVDEFVAGMLTSLAIVLYLVCIYDNNHETTIKERKIALFSHNKN